MAAALETITRRPVYLRYKVASALPLSFGSTMGTSILFSPNGIPGLISGSSPAGSDDGGPPPGVPGVGMPGMGTAGGATGEGGWAVTVTALRTRSRSKRGKDMEK